MWLYPKVSRLTKMPQMPCTDMKKWPRVTIHKTAVCTFTADKNMEYEQHGATLLGRRQ